MRRGKISMHTRNAILVVRPGCELGRSAGYNLCRCRASQIPTDFHRCSQIFIDVFPDFRRRYVLWGSHFGPSITLKHSMKLYFVLLVMVGLR